ncbi:MAG: SDR family NAD(P)-dependent oxidoreductase [Spirochaetes bacterium]|nr:MAG: SDR family NAD(P)-dependent oxidoreductase [Spirochaetota bacterium]
MKTSGNTVLITGGATGIGFALAKAMVHSGNEVILCGRRKSKLDAARKKLPGVDVKTCDIADPADRERLCEWVVAKYPKINMLVNNAGIQKTVDLKKGGRDIAGKESEIEINFSAVVGLSAYFIPRFMKRGAAAIVNVSSGLAFVPLAAVPVYCATKAAVHSFSLSMRRQLRDTAIKVFEIIPPIVDTDLHRGTRERRGLADRGISPEEVAAAAIAALANDEFECAVGIAKNLVAGSRSDPDRVFKGMNG